MQHYDYYNPNKKKRNRWLTFFFILILIAVILFIIDICTMGVCAWDNHQDNKGKYNDKSSCNQPTPFVSPIPTTMIYIPTPTVSVQPTETPVPSDTPSPTAGQSATPTPGPGPTPTPGTQINTAASANNISAPQSAPDTGRAE